MNNWSEKRDYETTRILIDNHVRSKSPINGPPCATAKSLLPGPRAQCVVNNVW